MLEEFKKFILRGNAVDMAVGIIVGAAFGKIVASLVNDILMPPIGLLLGGIDFSDLFLDLSGQSHPTLKAAEEAGAPVIKYGVFLNTVIEFLIIAFAIFLMIQAINRITEAGRQKTEDEAPTVKTCPECLSEVPAEARRCRYCTSEIS